MSHASKTIDSFKTKGSNLSEALAAVEADNEDYLCYCGCPKSEHQYGRGRCLHCWDCEQYEATDKICDCTDIFSCSHAGRIDELTVIRETEERERKRRMKRRQ